MTSALVTAKERGRPLWDPGKRSKNEGHLNKVWALVHYNVLILVH